MFLFSFFFSFSFCVFFVLFSVSILLIFLFLFLDRTWGLVILVFLPHINLWFFVLFYLRSPFFMAFVLWSWFCLGSVRSLVFRVFVSCFWLWPCLFSFTPGSCFGLAYCSFFLIFLVEVWVLDMVLVLFTCFNNYLKCFSGGKFSKRRIRS